MRNRYFWPLAGLFGVAGLIFTLTFATAQRPEFRPAIGLAYAAPGRFVAVHASPTAVLVMDTATGQIYKVTEFKRGDELPRIAAPVPARPIGRPPVDRDRPRPDGRRGDKEPSRDREAPRRESPPRPDGRRGDKERPRDREAPRRESPDREAPRRESPERR